MNTGKHNLLCAFIWIVVLVVGLYNGVTLHDEFWSSAAVDSAIKQAAIASYRIGMIVTAYVAGRALTSAIHSFGRTQ